MKKPVKPRHQPARKRCQPHTSIQINIESSNAKTSVSRSQPPPKNATTPSPSQPPAKKGLFRHLYAEFSEDLGCAGSFVKAIIEPFLPLITIILLPVMLLVIFVVWLVKLPFRLTKAILRWFTGQQVPPVDVKK